MKSRVYISLASGTPRTVYAAVTELPPRRGAVAVDTELGRVTLAWSARLTLGAPGMLVRDEQSRTVTPWGVLADEICGLGHALAMKQRDRASRELRSIASAVARRHLKIALPGLVAIIRTEESVAATQPERAADLAAYRCALAGIEAVLQEFPAADQSDWKHRSRHPQATALPIAAE